ncbi:Delta(12)-fatty-acid desaturase [Defluviimonas aquaemixtae]|uniref:Delta(12)-fatty-acid desaturase n=1 Tax=Albidovulum aquaemixtae TaxID=1542388 RepID=A0A2R8B797_9RHOB|nr:fatty acid desaturase [Defluviimonas aquaemixtae]SPH18412.1 Delta(12)-fatty-acid desaturase [Defluviimonas aquaemixtae]
MSDHKSFLAALPASDKAALTETSNRAGLTHLAAHGGLILVTGFLIVLKVPFWPLLLLVQGVLITFLFTLEHECTHKTPFRSERLNDWVGRVAGFLILNPFEWFRYFHLAHHRYTNLPGQDPELAGAKPETLGLWIAHVSGLPYWRGNLAVLARLVTGRFRAPYAPERALPRMAREARVMALLYAAALGSLIVSPLLFWVWLLPVLLGQPALRLYLLAEHGDCPFVANMFENTRTTYTNRIVRFLTWNMPYHVEHHVFPAVPFHRLPDLHRRMRDALKVTADGYAAFTRDYLARRL